MFCYDPSAHLVEDMKNARTDVPGTILLVVYIGTITGFVFLVSICFSIQDVHGAATSPLGVPCMQVLYDCIQSLPATSVLSIAAAVTNIDASAGLTAEAGRTIWAFARDAGLPHSTLFANVFSSGVPTAAICLATAGQIALVAIYLAISKGFKPVVSNGL